MPKSAPRGVQAKAAGIARAPPPPPGEEEAEDDEDEYDPFAEMPAPHVAPKAKAAQSKAAQPKSKPLPPWRQAKGKPLPPPASIQRQRDLQARAAAAAERIAGTVPPPLPMPKLVPLSAMLWGQRAVKGVGKGGKGKGVAKAPVQGFAKGALAKAPVQGFAKGAAKGALAKAKAKALVVPRPRPPPPPDPRKGLKEEPIVPENLNEMAVAEAAADWANNRGPSRTMLAAARFVEQKVKGSDGAKATASAPAAVEPAWKKRKLEAQKPAAPVFRPELLAKAPANLQTCRSLLLFLEKKLDEKEAERPPVKGPQALHPLMFLVAGIAGRLAGVAEKSGWDARAKRVLDIAAASTEIEGVAALAAAKKRLEGLQEEVKKKLKEKGEEGTLEVLVAERQAWEQARLKRSWLAWCAQLLRAREAALLAEADGAAVPAVGGHKKTIGAVEVLQAILAGDLPPGASARA